MRNSPGGFEKGLTLMELLIALSLFSAIMGFLMNSFFQFQRQSDRMGSMLRLRQEIRTLERIIRKDLQAIIYLENFMKDPVNEPDDRKSGVYGINETFYNNDRDIIHMHVGHTGRFYRTLPFNRNPEIHEVSYYIEEVENSKPHFIRREEFYVDNDITAGDRSIAHTLSDNVVSFDIKYYKGNFTESFEEWDSSFYQKMRDKNIRVPSSIEITMELKDESGETLTSTLHVNIHPYMGRFTGWK